MKHRLLIWSTVLVLTLPMALRAQLLTPRVISSQGGHFQSPAFSVSYTIGELAAVNTISGNGFIFTQGFHQPDKFSIVNQIADAEANWNIYAFPNPVSNQLNLSLNSNKTFNLLIRITDAAGRLVFAQSGVKTVPGEQVIQLNFIDYAPGVYHIRLDDELSGATQVLKAIKSNF
jgi:hypothetical protein